MGFPISIHPVWAWGNPQFPPYPLTSLSSILIGSPILKDFALVTAQAVRTARYECSHTYMHTSLSQLSLLVSVINL